MSLPCETCGVAVARPGKTRTRLTHTRDVPDDAPASMHRAAEAWVKVTDCETCLARDARARELLNATAEGRSYLARRGTIAYGECGLVLAALSIIDCEDEVADTAALLVMTASMLPVARTLTSGTRSPGTTPFEHVDEEKRAAIRAGYGDALKVRVLVGRPALALSPPVGSGCGWCGQAAVTRSAVEVHRWGGAAAAAAGVWSTHSARGGSFALCPPCQSAYRLVGAIGPSAIERAFCAALCSEVEGASRRLLRDPLDAVPPAWMSTGLAPVEVGWSWVPPAIREAARSALRLPDPGPAELTPQDWGGGRASVLRPC
jgi:hypothetical protein